MNKDNIILLDQEKAYDRVSWEYLKNTLMKYGFKGRFLHLIQQIYSKMMSTITVNGTTSHRFNMNNGLKQGCPLSPLLYNLCIEPLIRKIEKELTGIEINNEKRFKNMAYADDICRN